MPWFWSDQYDLKLQTAGITSSAYDQTVLRGETSANKFSVFYLSASKLVALDAVNSPLEFNVAKRLIASAPRSLDAGQLANPQFEIKSLLSA